MRLSFKKNNRKPPSKDPHRPKMPQSLKKNNSKPSGGHSEHKGHSLKKVETPDIIVGL